MLEFNFWFWWALAAMVFFYKLELLSSLLNLSRLPSEPSHITGSHDEESWEQLRDYITTKTKFDILQSSISLGLLFAFWWGGGFGWLVNWVESWRLNTLGTGLAFIGVIWLATFLFGLPFEIWDTFGIEARFGFNKTSAGTFIGDRIKTLLLTFVLGAPLLLTLLWLFEHVAYAALYGYLIFTAFTLLLSFLAPRFLLPLFYQFKPLEDETLKAAVMKLSERLKFPVTEVSIIDGSRRSTKANAFFTGFGKSRRIALYDTLVEKQNEQEILAVLAHEIGHWNRRHVPKQMILSFVTTGILFTLLHFALPSAALSSAFGVNHAGTAWNLVFFLIVASPLSQLVGIISSWISRKFEFEADAFAKEAMHSGEPLASALAKLDKDHMSHPCPHPMEVFLHYSHPPSSERLAALAIPHLTAA